MGLGSSKFNIRLNHHHHNNRGGGQNSKGSKGSNNSLLNINDDEIDRVQLQHHVGKCYWGANFSAPLLEQLRNGEANVLDVGCGPATWLCDMATDFRCSNFYGVDIDRTFPNQLPYNVQIVLADITTRIPFKDIFDLVYMRHMLSYFIDAQWEKRIIPELLRVTKSGGYIEIQEAEYGFQRPGPILADFEAKVRKRSRDPLFIRRLPTLLNNTGQFGPVREEERTYRLGRWGGELGEMMATNVFSMLLFVLTRAKVIEKNDIPRIMQTLRTELEKQSTTVKYYRYYAQKL
ncbi:hypothetical protein G9A89_010113 [Geosiphon pyriformis]|nr:hypothetical protein G9A89_010113 [Geosiphon pyriformis]